MLLHSGCLSLSVTLSVRWNIELMRKNISDALNIDIDQINIKATTEEGLGFTGEMLGISAQSIASVN